MGFLPGTGCPCPISGTGAKKDGRFGSENRIKRNMIKSMNIAWWVERWRELHPQKTVILHEGRRISYQELDGLTHRTACWLRSLGIKKGDRVAAMLGSCPEFIEIYLACSRMGALFVPINFRLVGPELEYILRNAEPRVFVFDTDYLEEVTSLRLGDSLPDMRMACVGSHSAPGDILDYEGETAVFRGQEATAEAVPGPSDPEEPQVIMYTSGTTGRPKGAVLSHRKTFFNCLNADLFFKLHFDDIMLVVLPLFHSGGLFIQASPTIYKGTTMVIHSGFDPYKVYEDIRSLGVTKFLGVPTIYRALLQVAPEERGDLSSLKVCAIGGERTTVDLLEQCRAARFPVRQIMGQTETSILLWASEEDAIRKPGTVGRPVFHAEVALVDREGTPVRVGQVGEIVVRGSIMMSGYWRDAAATRETIRHGWLHTGDLARMDEEGYFYLVDRVKDMYISGGENVYPAEVEQVLRTHPDIEDVAVVGVPDRKWGEVGHAFVISRSESRVHPEDVMALCRGRLARYKWPKHVSFCEDFPRTPLGKVRKSLLIQTREG
jgi:fatty-acyl-CoA synthase